MEERTSPQAVHLAEVRLLLFLGFCWGLGCSVTALLLTVTVRTPKPPAGSPYRAFKRAICRRIPTFEGL